MMIAGRPADSATMPRRCANVNALRGRNGVPVLRMQQPGELEPVRSTLSGASRNARKPRCQSRSRIHGGFVSSYPGGTCEAGPELKAARRRSVAAALRSQRVRRSRGELNGPANVPELLGGTRAILPAQLPPRGEVRPTCNALTRSIRVFPTRRHQIPPTDLARRMLHSGHGPRN